LLEVLGTHGLGSRSDERGIPLTGSWRNGRSTAGIVLK